jgi:hypothetical protein
VPFCRSNADATKGLLEQVKAHATAELAAVQIVLPGSAV